MGPRLAIVFAKKAVTTAWDMLHYFPVRYVDRRQLSSIAQLQIGQKESFLAKIIEYHVTTIRGRRRKLMEILVGDGQDHAIITLFQFNENYLKKRFPPGSQVLFFGEVRVYRGLKNLVHPDMEVWDDDDAGPGAGRLVPIYPLTEGLYQKTVRNIISKNFEALLELVIDEPRSVRDGDPVPLSLVEALRYLHQPPVDADVALLNERKTVWHQRVIYDEFFYLQLALLARRRVQARQHAFVVGPRDIALAHQCAARLPFELTGDQKQVLHEIIADFQTARPMNRMLQGDVGSGKTIVAFLSALPIMSAGYQAALMVPTEILAEQHYHNLNKLAQPLNIEVGLLTGAIKGKQRKQIHQDLQTGALQLLIGTHALITPDVVFNKLGYVIIDEQHRFGVVQRALLKQKTSVYCGQEILPHLLIMTATPIPRTLSMCVYGDLDMSLIREMPKGRLPVITKLYREAQLEQMHQFIAQELRKGRQAYFVYPLIEESEKSDLKDATLMHQKLQKVFSDRTVGLIHGKLKAAEKESIMGQFKAGRLHVLVSTTVIEVGVDVPNATIMVVEHAERFGLSQLHQLRGRVGRGAERSYCFLVAQYAQSEESRYRLRIMEQTTNGFEIAEEDLRIRGPGEFLGTRQSGLPDFRLAEIVRDQHLLVAAQKRAALILHEDPNLNLPKNGLIKNIMLERWGNRLELGTV